MFRGTVGKVAIITLGGATLLAFGSVWGQNRPPRNVPNALNEENRLPPDTFNRQRVRGQDPSADDDQILHEPQRVRAVPAYPGPVYGPYSPSDYGPGRMMEADQFMSEVSSLVDIYRQAKDEKARAGTRTKIISVLSKKFDSQHQRREKEIAALKARLKEFTELQEKRGADRKGIIERHADFLLREVDGLGWEQDFQFPEGMAPST
jgi:hypothetical protein